MKELEQLETLWKHKIRRTTELIISLPEFNNMANSLNNDHWKYIVPYSFLDALDIKYEQRMKNKKPYMVWTQGPILRFKDGDFITSRSKENAVQILSANPMGWDTEKEEMYQGVVSYDVYSILNNGKYKKTRSNMCNQMQFLELLIYGKHHFNCMLNDA